MDKSKPHRPQHSLPELRYSTEPDGVPPMEFWLDVLRAAIPIQGMLIIGPGVEPGWLMDWVRRSSVNLSSCPIYVVDADDESCKELEESLADVPGVAVKKAVISGNGGATSFTNVTKSNENGVLAEEALRALWPNIKIRSQASLVESKTLDEVYESMSGPPNWAFLDFLPAAPTLRGGGNALRGIEVLLVRVAEGLPGELEAHLSSVEDILVGKGFQRTHIQSERHPALRKVLYVRNERRQIDELRQSLAEAQYRIDDLEESLTANNRRLDHAFRDAEAALGEVRVLQGAQAAKSADSVSGTTCALLGQPELSRQLQDSNHDLLSAFSEELEKTKSKLFGDVSRVVANASKQVEAFLSIQRFLESGAPILEFHGWPISPDLGAFLIQLSSDVKYDLIIEFGSGTSTVLLARALQLRHSASPNNVEIEVGHLCGKVYTFEHDAGFLAATQRMVGAHSLDAQVCLNLSPLREWEDETGSYTHYDAEDVLARLGRELNNGRGQRILVLVDGPPGTACLHSRYPAVPKVFEHLSRADIDLVLDDASRSQEQAIIELWRDYWKRRFISVSDEVLVSEKGIYWAHTCAGQFPAP